MSTFSNANPFGILGLSHVGLWVDDLEASCAFYRDFLGFAEQCRLNYLDTGEVMLTCFKINEDQWMEFFRRLGPEENRMHQIAFRVTDAEAIRVRLATNGMAVPPATPKGQMGNYNFTAPGPEGQIIEFVQHLPTGLTARDRGRFLPGTRISTHLQHAGIVVADVAEADRYFGEILGLQETWRGSIDGRTLSWIHRRLPSEGDYVEYMLDRGVAPHFCLEVADATLALAQLEQSPYRARYHRPLGLHLGRNGHRIINVFDPDGIRIELMEPKPANGQSVVSSTAPLPAL